MDFFLVENKEFVQEEAEGIGLEGKEKDKGEEGIECKPLMFTQLYGSVLLRHCCETRKD